jgi:serine/threonine protein kinase
MNMPDLTGLEIGRYHIIERLGQGGMAEVYKAFDTRLERDVAVKVIRMDAFAATIADRMLKRFEREAKSLAKLKHASIVNIYDYGEYNGEPYLVSIYTRKCTSDLQQYCTTNHRQQCTIFTIG